MKYAISLNSVVPVRAEASEKAEMVTQLLFGEFCEVLQRKDSFIEIKNYFDEYRGWVDAKMLTEISANEYLQFTKAPLFRVCELNADVFCLTDKTIYHLPAGSILPNYHTESSKFGIAGFEFQIHPSYATYLNGMNPDGIVPIALTFLNIPYLWGGKNMMGIDCSGLAQTVYALNGFILPRDASQQALVGNEIAFEEVQPGDLLFFGKEGKTTHVGIYLDNFTLIHASGKVKKSTVDATGIKANQSSDYTHYLTTIRRLEYSL